MAARNILFVHQNFPAQFPHIAEALRRRGDRLAAIGSATAKNLPGIDVRRWTNQRGTTPNILEDAVRAEADMIRGRAAAAAALQLRRDGFRPDLIIGHPGWGETLHMREIFPEAKQILFGEFYYVAHGGDIGFDPEFEQLDFDLALRSTAKNATQALAYTMADQIVVPTPFQASTFPDIFRPLIEIHHEGVDLAKARRRPDARVQLANGRVIDARTPVITFISRTLERLRGFHVFMRALPALQAAIPDAEVLIIGNEEGTGYGGPIPAGFRTWSEWLLTELGPRLDLSRVHFLGRQPHDKMIDALSIGRAHVYYSYPFVLSWSLVEAMACECLILASNTPPVRDAVTNGQDGLLNDFFNIDALSRAMIMAASRPDDFTEMRTRARESARRFDRESRGVPGWLDLIDATLS